MAVVLKEPGEDGADAIIRMARARMNEAYSAEQPHRERAEDDLRNVIGDQWPDEERNERESEGRAQKGGSVHGVRGRLRRKRGDRLCRARFRVRPCAG